MQTVLVRNRKIFHNYNSWHLRCIATWGCMTCQSFWVSVTRPIMHQPTYSRIRNAHTNQISVKLIMTELLRFHYVQFGRHPPSWIWPEVIFLYSAASGDAYCNDS